MTDTVPVNAIGLLRREHPERDRDCALPGRLLLRLKRPAPPFKGNSKLRKSLALAIDRKQLVAGLALGQAAAYSFVPPGTWNYEPQPSEWK